MLPVSVKVGASNLAEWGRQAANRINDLIGKLSGYLPLTGGTLTGDLIVPDEAYGVAWNGSTEVPTKNALYDKIETLGGGGGTTTNPLTMNNGGAGAASGTTFDGSVARTISYNTVGAAATSHTHAQADVTNLVTDLAAKQPLDADLTALAANSTDGFWAHTGAGTGAARTLTAPAAGLTISNPAGIAGNPTFALANDLSALEALAGTNTIYYRSAADTWTAVTIGGNLTFSGGTLNAGTPARVLITETTTSGSATNVSFTGIAATYRDLEVRVRGRGTKVATLVDIRMRFNADTGGNYDIESQQANNTTNTNFANAAATSAYIGNIAAASATANVADFIQIHVADYRGTTFQKSGQYIAGLKTGTAAGNLFNEVGSIWWRSTAAITQIDVFPSGNAFVDGSVVSLYGVM